MECYPQIVLPLIDLGPSLDTGALIFERDRPTSTPSAFPPHDTSSPRLETPPSALLLQLQKAFPPDPVSSSHPPLAHSPSSVGERQTFEDGSDSLSWYGPKVVWSNGVEVVRSYSFLAHQTVVQALFASFDTGTLFGPSSSSSSHSLKTTRTFANPTPASSSSDNSSSDHHRSSRTRAVCIFFRDSLSVYLPSGHCHDVRLPFAFRRAWPLRAGLLMQKECRVEDHPDPFAGHPSSLSRTSSFGPLRHSSLFSLSDLYNVRPVLVDPQSPHQKYDGLPSSHSSSNHDSTASSSFLHFVSSPTPAYPFTVAVGQSTSNAKIIIYNITPPSSSSKPSPPPRASTSPVVPTTAIPPTSSTRSLRRSSARIQSRKAPQDPDQQSKAQSPSSMIRRRSTLSRSTGPPSNQPLFDQLSNATEPYHARLSMGRNDLNKSMDRMALSGVMEDEEGAAAAEAEEGMEEQDGAKCEAMLSVREVSNPFGSPIAKDQLQISLVPTSPTTSLLHIYALSISSLAIYELRASPSTSLDVRLRSQQSQSHPPIPYNPGAIPFSSEHLYLDPDEGILSIDQSGPRHQPMRTSRQHPLIQPAPVVTRSLTPSSSSFSARLSFPDGFSSVINTVSPPSGLISRCLASLSFVLPSESMRCLRASVAASAQGKGREEAWRVFSSLFFRHLGVDGEEPTSSPNKRGWERLLKSRPGRQDEAIVRLRGVHRNRDILLSSSPAPAAPLQRPEETAGCLFALHLLAEDCKLDLEAFTELESLAPVLVRMGSTLGRSDWVDYWVRLVPSSGAAVVSSRMSLTNPPVSIPSPPDIYAHLSLLLQRKVDPSAWTDLASLSHSLGSFQPHPLSSGSLDPCGRTAFLRAVYTAISSASTSSSDSTSASINAMVSNGITPAVLDSLPLGIALPLQNIIRTCQASPSTSLSPKAYVLIRRPDLARRLRTSSGVTSSRSAKRTTTAALSSIKELTSDSSSGKTSLPAATASGSFRDFRFGSDRRLEEVERMLSTTRVVTVRLPARPNQSDADIAAAEKLAAAAISLRTFSLPVGQGIFAFATSEATISINKAWLIPPIDLSVHFLPTNSLLVETGSVSSDARDWSNFHNGVAASLRISPSSKGIDSSWIVFNRPADPSPTHAGFLLGLGLTGHLRKMFPFHANPYLDSRHDFTSSGLLIGLAASYAGTEDVLLTRILSLHVQALLPHGARELTSSPLIEAAALLSIGILYTGSRNRKMAEVALAEISRQSSATSETHAIYAESYAFSAAMAFGMIMVGRGGDTGYSGDVEMVLKLKERIFGVVELPNVQEHQKTVEPIDVNITAPGATVALGLMYLRSGRHDIADILEIPQTRFDLDLLRPDLVLLRVLSRSLILWNGIAASQEWVESNVPDFVKSAMRKRKRTGGGMDVTLELAYFNIVAGACFAIGLKNAGTARSSVHALLLHYYDVFWAASNTNPTTFQGRIRLSTSRSCLNVVAISLGLVLAGTGDLSVLSRLRLAHGQQEKGTTFGSHMAIHIAIGLLFLGEGKYTLGSSNASIAALVCAFFPRSNHSQSDNKAYPQAYRHLWALAVEPRCFVAHDIDTGESVYLPIKVKIREDDVVRSLPLIAPTLIPGFDLLLSVKIDSPRYWPINLDLLGNQADRQTLSQNDIVFVKRKSGFLSYDADPKGNRSIFVQAGLIGSAPDLGPMAVEPIEPSSSFSSSKGGALGMLDGQVSSLTSHPLLVSFFRRLCGDHSLSHPSTVLKSFCSAAFLECLISDQPQLLALYLHCRQLLLAQFSTPFLPLVIQNIHLAQRFQASSACYTPVLRSSLLQEVSQSIERLSQTSGAATLLSHYIHQGFEQSLTLPEFERLSVYLHVNQVPSGPVLSVLRQLVSEARRQSIQVGKTSAQEVETLERGLKLVLTTTARKVASGAEWRLGSVEDVLQAWR